MSDVDLYELLDTDTLRGLNLPRTLGQRRGLGDVLLHKVLNMVYLVNGLEKQPSKVVEPAGILGGVVIRPPQSEWWLVYSMRWTVTTTATAGSRQIRVRKLSDITGQLVYAGYISTTMAASSTHIYQMHQGNATADATFNLQLSQPVPLVNPQFILAQDLNVIDLLDLAQVNYEYTAFQV